MNIEPEFADLKKVIENAGQLARDYFYSDVNLNVQKADGSVVTEIDQKAEAMIRAHIEARFPHDTIVGEEGDTKVGDSDFVWYIDPIDGTDNFVRKIPFFAVTATRLGPTAEDSMAIIHNPVSNQTFASVMENGSYENQHLLNMTADTIGGRYFINVEGASRDFPWIKTARPMMWKSLSERFGKSSAYQCALLQFAYVGAGRIDGLFSLMQAPWDTAAGLYLVKAAGGAISLYDEEGDWQRYEGAIKDIYQENPEVRRNIFVSHPDIHVEVLEFVGDPKGWTD